MSASRNTSESRWAHLRSTGAKLDVSPEEAIADDGWRWLLIEHMPFHALEDKERNRVVDQLAQLENEILKHNGDERVPELPTERVPYVWSGIDTRVLTLRGEGRRLIARQARLMEQAFVQLRLDRYANAPANRGIMNLFRAWGSSRAFNVVLEESRAVFGKPFLTFYAFYIRGQQSIDKRPVPHPWDRDVIREQTRVSEERIAEIREEQGKRQRATHPETQRETQPEKRPEFNPQETGFPWKLKRSFAGEGNEETFEDYKGDGPGIYLDSGIIEADRHERSQLSARQKDESTKAKEELPKS
jgi:hypothetical protein